MRLLKTGPYVPGDETLEVIQRWGKDIPPYAFLSHTWSADPQDEVLLSDVQRSTCSSKPAYAKLENAMIRAKLDGYGWLWVDTCCIDKTSSVELSEAINSISAMHTYPDVTSEGPSDEFKESRWWERGWTLQELLAPWRLEFFNSQWESMGYRDCLHEAITEITGIEREYLTKSSPIMHASIAKRMSWASSRRTTREEDMAYSLLGIFDVNMPMLYGEGGARAFYRLQEEIMRGNEDQSLFAWVKSGEVNEAPGSYHGMLADSPEDFAHTGNTVPYTDYGDYNPSTMTARGLHMTFPVTSKQHGVAVAALRCTAPGIGHNGWLAVYLQKLPTGKAEYARIDCGKLASVSELGGLQELYVRQSFQSFTVQVIYPYHFFQLRSLAYTGSYEHLNDYKIVRARQLAGVSQAKAMPLTQPSSWCLVPKVYQIDKTAGSVSAALLIKRSLDQEAFVLLLGTSSDFTASISICEDAMFDAPTSLQSAFFQQPPGPCFELESHRVRVNLEERVRDDQKICYVDLEIDAIPLPPTAAEMLQGVADVFTSSDRRAARAKIRDKVKHFLPV